MNLNTLYAGSNPKPMINMDKKIAAFFSAKSGCTFVAKWFFYQIGHLQAAQDFNDFIHQYRVNVYTKSTKQGKSVKDFLASSDDYLKIKVIRNPFERAVSSYIHFLGMHKNKHPHTKKDFGVDYSKLDYSFEEFLDMLAKIDIRKCNIHWRHQFQPIEQALKFDEVIDLNSSIKVFAELEEKYKLKKHPNLERLAHSGHHSKSNKTQSQDFCGCNVYSFDIKKKRPDYKYFFNDALEQKVVSIYKKDFVTYNLEKSYVKVST